MASILSPYLYLEVYLQPFYHFIWNPFKTHKSILQNEVYYNEILQQPFGVLVTQLFGSFKSITFICMTIMRSDYYVSWLFCACWTFMRKACKGPKLNF